MVAHAYHPSSPEEFEASFGPCSEFKDSLSYLFTPCFKFFKFICIVYI
jgi:hypothetical protein